MAFKEILKKAQDGRQLVSLFFDPENWDSFALGYVDKLDETHIRLHSLDRYGRFSGYEVRELGDIIKLEMGGHYENKVARFHSAKSSELFKEVIV
ncbi:MAG: hypothetical protein JJ879_09715 [Sneathiella sp.]|nr:hypothetical protein [Sneathiella sp.]